MFVSTNEKAKKKKNLLMTQTTPDASFGPVLVVSAFLLRISLITIYKMFVSKEKSEEKKEKPTNDPNDARRVVWARFGRLDLRSLFPSRIS
jgi:hypothetical protein